MYIRLMGDQYVIHLSWLRFIGQPDQLKVCLCVCAPAFVLYVFGYTQIMVLMAGNVSLCLVKGLVVGGGLGWSRGGLVVLVGVTPHPRLLG